MGIFLGKDQGLRDFGAAGEDVGKKLFLEGADHGADLVYGHDGAVECLFIVFQVFVELFPADLTGVAVTFVDVKAGFDLAALFRDPGTDAKDLIPDINLVRHRPLVVVFHDQVLVEKAEGLLGGCGGEAYDKGVEILQDLAPLVIDGAVALVRYYEVKGFDGDVGIVDDFLDLVCGEIRKGHFILFCVEFPAFEHGIEPLDGCDTDFAHRIDVGAREELDIVELRELAAVIRGYVLGEFPTGLAAQGAAVDQEEDASGLGEFDQAVDEAYGRVGLAASCSHLDKRPGPGLFEGYVEVGDGFDLAVAEVFGSERREFFEAGSQGGILGGPFEECLRFVEGKETPGEWIRIFIVSEICIDAGAFIGKGQGGCDMGNSGREITDIFGGLFGHAAEGGAGGFGLDDAYGFPVGEQGVVDRPGIGVEFPDGDSWAGT